MWCYKYFKDIVTFESIVENRDNTSTTYTVRLKHVGTFDLKNARFKSGTCNPFAMVKIYLIKFPIDLELKSQKTHERDELQRNWKKFKILQP